MEKRAREWCKTKLNPVIECAQWFKMDNLKGQKWDKVKPQSLHL